MNHEEMQQILVKMARFDPRRTNQTDEETALAWLEIFHPVPFHIADEAVTRLYSVPDLPDFLHAGRLLQTCKEIRSERRERKAAELEAEYRRELPAAPERPMTPVESPFLKWEHARRRPAWQEPEPEQKIITDPDKIIDLEARRRRMLAALELLMTEEERSGLGQPSRDGEGVLGGEPGEVAGGGGGEAGDDDAHPGEPV